MDTKRVGLLFNLMYSSRLFQDLESWTKVLTGMHHLLAFAVKMVDYAQKKTLCVRRRTSTELCRSTNASHPM